MYKTKKSPFYLPSCTLKPTSGIILSRQVSMPIAKYDIQDEWIINWAKFERKI